MRVQSLRQAVFTLVATASLAFTTGCGGNTTVSGSVGDGLGRQEQGLSRGSTLPDGLGGEGTVAAATRVEAVTLVDGQAVEVVASAEVDAKGFYKLTLPSGDDALILNAIDADGKVIASALLESTAETDTAIAPTMDSESSLEAHVYAEMRATSEAFVNATDVRARITQKLAAEVRESRDDAQKKRERIGALAAGIRAAQEAQVKAHAEAGLTVSQEELARAHAEAGLTLNAALAAGTNAAEAYATFFESIAAKLEERGVEEKEQADGERQASASFRVVVEAKLDADPMVELAAIAAASAEARASALAVEAVLEAANASAEAKAKAVEAAKTLRARLATAANAAAAAEAFAAFSASIATDASASGTVLGQTFGVSIVEELAVDTAVSATLAAGASLDASLDALVTAGDSVDPVAVASAVATAYDTYATTVRAQATALGALGAGATPAVELLLIAEGGFRFR